MLATPTTPDQSVAPSAAWPWRLLEVALLVVLFFLWAGWPPPDVNEAHYLAKAKHYWNPAWCRGDQFLTSADAHLVFYWTIGWLTLWLPLPVVAWVGRLVTWSLLAWAWQRLSYRVVPVRLAAVLSAALLLLFHQRCHMAGEWIVGGVEAKGLAYVFVWLALEALLRQRWRTAWAYLGLATAFHVLVGGWSVLAAGVAWCSCGRLRPPWRSMLPGLGLGLLLAVPGLLPALLLNRGVDPGILDQANYIYVFERLPHHLLVHTFPREFLARHAGLLAVWLAVCLATPCPVARGLLGQRPLRGFVGGAVAIALAGMVIDQLLIDRWELSAALLRYYWYRLSDAMLPVGAALALVAGIHALGPRRPVWARVLLAVCLLAGAVNLGVHHYRQRGDLRPAADAQALPIWEESPEATRQVYGDWRRVCEWIRTHTAPTARFLTPRRQQTFKWYAERAEVASWKDVPQDAAALFEWWQRQDEIYYCGLVMHGEERLLELARQYDFQYILIDRQSGPQRLNLPRVYPSRFDTTYPSYEVYRVPDE